MEFKKLIQIWEIELKINEIKIPHNLVEKTKKKILNSIKIDEKTKCWILTKYFHNNKNNGKFSYGKMSINIRGVRKHYFVHRLSYSLFNNEIPNGCLVLHKCNNYKCVNPDHLYTGDQRQNMKDCKLAGRDNKARGERNNKSVFNEDDIRKIFILNEMQFSQYQISRLYKVSPNHIGRILRRLSWKHVQINEDDFLRFSAEFFKKEER